MKISELRKTLSSVESLLERTRADTDVRSGLASLNAWLGQFDALSVTELCGTTGMPEPRTRAKKSATPTVDAQVVEEFTARLAGIERDRSSFEDVLAQMKSDKRVRASEASEIAQRYVGGTSKYKSKADALKEIKLRFEAGLRAAQRLRAASEIY